MGNYIDYLWLELFLLIAWGLDFFLGFDFIFYIIPILFSLRLVVKIGLLFLLRGGEEK